MGASKRIFASVRPNRGTCLVFWQKGLVHEGADITHLSNRCVGDSKIILRSDVFFNRKPEPDQAGACAADSEAAKLFEEAEEYEEAGDFEMAAKLFEKATQLVADRS